MALPGIPSSFGKQTGIIRVKVNLKWKQKEVETALYARLSRNLIKATKFYHQHIQDTFLRQSWGSNPVKGGLLRKTFKVSAPGRPPFKQTSNLAKSIRFSFKTTTQSAFFSGRELRGRTSTEVKYAQNIELGSGKTGTIRIPQSQKIHTRIRLVNPLPKRKAILLFIAARPVWIPTLRKLKPQILKILAS